MLGDGDKAGELFSMLNPINHASTPDAVQRYKVEPYVACADVYSMPPHVGRGGWTWYTGSAGWMYRAGLEWILGFRLQGASLADGSLHSEDMAGLQHRASDIAPAATISRSKTPTASAAASSAPSSTAIALPGNEARISLADDGATHRVRVVLG